MSRLTRIDNPISLFEEILQPFKGGYGMTPRTWEVGTREKPTIVVRRELVEKKYKAWQDADGSYHEELVTDEKDVENYGGTDPK
jgi:hypothetical protein|tara:strand:+ start:3294 stop:3545 length:252 start_codon:yes stop_codon:yes gene_type:complete